MSECPNCGDGIHLRVMLLGPGRHQVVCGRCNHAGPVAEHERVPPRIEDAAGSDCPRCCDDLRIRVERVGEIYRTACECGYTGPPRRTAAEARSHQRVLEHLREREDCYSRYE